MHTSFFFFLHNAHLTPNSGATSLAAQTNNSVYYYIVYLEYLRQFLIGKQDEYEYIWGYVLLPRVQRRKTPLVKKTQ